MRTNIVLSDELIREAMRYTAAKSKQKLIEEALRTFVNVKAAERRQTTYRARLRQLDAKLRHVHLKESPADVLRADRDRS